ncbi:hypothetical protein [Haloarchaeobius sp. TZWSO28]|uniref:hypothetical protein n=1 Tax=Haloarchaeobius sp. TZWSO28 TaxID=3446119 RepID=UPI003EC025A6
MRNPVTRRNVLLGASGMVLTGVGVGVTRDALDLDPVSFTAGAVLTPDGTLADTNSQQTDRDGRHLRVDWREEYNGRVVENPDVRTEGQATSGPLIDLDDVKPGDEGLLVLQVSVAREASRVVLSLPLVETDENGQNEAEEKSPDPLPGRGELQRHVDLALWYDSGVVVESIGSCNGDRERGESLIAAGTLAAVADQLEAGRVLTPPGASDGCLAGGDSFCLTLHWALDEDVDNVIQSDSASFVVGLQLQPCR